MGTNEPEYGHYIQVLEQEAKMSSAPHVQGTRRVVLQRWLAGNGEVNWLTLEDTPERRDNERTTKADN